MKEFIANMSTHELAFLSLALDNAADNEANTEVMFAFVDTRNKVVSVLEALADAVRNEKSLREGV